MNSLTYTRYEIIRGFRNRRYFIFSLIFPLVLFLFVAGTNRHVRLGGISFPLYYMTGMIAWGSMIAVMGGGARIAVERQAGWTRQMRITPLSIRAYFRAKILSGYTVAALSIVLIALAGVSYGVHLSAGQWATMIALVLVGLIPFAIMGILLGHLLTPDSMGPGLGGLTALFALLGGAWAPLATHGVFLDIVKLIPSYWLVQAGKTALGNSGWPAEGWIVMAAWTLAALRLAIFVYRRDTARVTGG
ncbi:MAG: ABC transporter permease [Acidimicrobiaceae bacterium]|nr:ABC transporter permease [Acidimicrobiaceae bacterium]